VLELDQLDRLQEIHWSRALQGDVEAAELILDIIDRRSRLLRLIPGDADPMPAAEPSTKH